MPNQSKAVEDMKAQFANYFYELSYGIQHTKIKFKGVDELINFAVLDIVTGLFHMKSCVDHERFIDNLAQIVIGLKSYHSKEKAS